MTKAGLLIWAAIHKRMESPGGLGPAAAAWKESNIHWLQAPPLVSVTFPGDRQRRGSKTVLKAQLGCVHCLVSVWPAYRPGADY